MFRHIISPFVYSTRVNLASVTSKNTAGFSTLHLSRACSQEGVVIQRQRKAITSPVVRFVGSNDAHREQALSAVDALLRQKVQVDNKMEGGWQKMRIENNGSNEGGTANALDALLLEMHPRDYPLDATLNPWKITKITKENSKNLYNDNDNNNNNNDNDITNDITNDILQDYKEGFQAMNRNARKPRRANKGKRPCSRISRRAKRRKNGSWRRGH